MENNVIGPKFRYMPNQKVERNIQTSLIFISIYAVSNLLAYINEIHIFLVNYIIYYGKIGVYSNEKMVIGRVAILPNTQYTMHLLYNNTTMPSYTTGKTCKKKKN